MRSIAVRIAHVAAATLLSFMLVLTGATAAQADTSTDSGGTGQHLDLLDTWPWSQIPKP